MVSEAVLRIKVITDTVAAAAGLDKVDASAGRMRKGLATAAIPAAAAGAAVLAFGKAATDAASRAQQAMGGVDAVFGKSADNIHKWSQTAADSAGLAAAEYEELTTVLGAQLKNMGIPMDQLAKKSDSLVRMGADMSATFGGTAKEAVEALSSALRGETDPIERYGVSVKQADIAARMAADGTDKLEGSAAKQAKTAALLALVTEQTADSQGAFAREADTAAGQSQRTAAKMEDMQAALGEALLPALTVATEYLGKLFTWMSENQTATMVLVGIIGALAAAIMVANAALAIMALVAAPVALVAVAIVAIGVALVVAYNKVGWFRAWVDAQFNGIKTIVMAVARFLVAAWTQAVAAVRATITGVSRAWTTVSGAVRSAVGSLVGWVKSTWTSAVAAVSRAVDGVRSAWASVVGAVRGLVSDVAHFLVSAIGGAIDTVSGAIRRWRDVASGVFGAVQAAMGRVWAVFRDLGGKIRGLMSGASGWLVSVGSSIVQGLVNGINNGIQWVRQAVENLAGAIPGWVKNKLGIASPSKVLAKIGKQITDGLVVGIDDGLANVQAITEQMATTVSSTMDKAFKNDKRAASRTREVLSAVKDESAALRANARARDVNTAALADANKALDEARGKYDQLSSAIRDNALAYAAVTNLGEEATDAGSMATAMDARVAAVEAFAGTLQRLRNAGLAEQVIQDLAAAGVEGGLAQAQAIEAGGPAMVAQFNALQARLSAAAAILGDQTAAAMYGAGVQSAQALVDGLVLDQATLNTAAETLANELAKAVRKALRKALRGAGGGGGDGADNRSVAASSVAPVVPIGRGRSAAVATGPTVIVNGALDPEAVARQIRRILTGHDRRVGHA